MRWNSIKFYVGLTERPKNNNGNKPRNRLRHQIARYEFTYRILRVQALALFGKVRKKAPIIPTINMMGSICVKMFTIIEMSKPWAGCVSYCIG